MLPVFNKTFWQFMKLQNYWKFQKVGQYNWHLIAIEAAYNSEGLNKILLQLRID